MSKVIVITGSTKGIGYGLAEEFLKRGCSVVVSGRNQTALDNAVAALSAKYKNVAGCLCDVTRFEDHEQLFAFAQAKFGRVDVWVNNAGISLPRYMLWEQPKDNHDTIVAANLMGVIYGSQVAIKGMLAQGGGHVVNVSSVAGRFANAGSGVYNLGSGSDSVTLANGTNTFTVSNVETVVGDSGADTITLGGSLGTASSISLGDGATGGLADGFGQGRFGHG